MCNHCPFVIHLRGQVLGLLQNKTCQIRCQVLFFCIADALIQLARDVQPLGVEVIGISSNSVVTHPQDGPEKMAEDARSFGTSKQLQLCAPVCVSL